MARTALRLAEGALLVTGVALALWCSVVLLEARYVSGLPLPAVPDIHTGLPRAAISNGDVVAKFDAPTVNLSATVLEGSGDAVLAVAAGHIEGTPFPGAPGNVGIAGHRDTTFRAVRNLKVGDPLLLETRTGVYEYRISSTIIVNPGDVWVLNPTDRPVLTLVTCYPFVFIGHAPKRYIVKADLVGTR
jgi:sortase A